MQRRQCAIVKRQNKIAYNAYTMRALNLVIPFSLPPVEHARDLLAQLQAPALAKLLSRASLKSKKTGSGLDACLPHERWLAGHSSDNSPAVSATLMAALGLKNETGYWFVLQPVHLHVERDHLVLTDYRQLNLNDSESKTLFDAAHPLFEEQNQRLLFGSKDYWFMQADAWADFRTCTPDAACGHNIDVWSPSGGSSREWRRLQNEVQMLWHQHPLNESREQNNQPRVNGLWLWGGSQANESSPGLHTLASHLNNPHPAVDTSASEPTTHILDSLSSAALADDWSSWLHNMSAIDHGYLAPALAALDSGKLEVVNVILSDSTRLVHWSIARNSFRKFWAKPSLNRLAA